mgnify:CR=1 FL=1
MFDSDSIFLTILETKRLVLELNKILLPLELTRALDFSERIMEIFALKGIGTFLLDFGNSSLIFSQRALRESFSELYSVLRVIIKRTAGDKGT